MNKQFFIFTDGSAIGNPGPAGWAAIVIHGTRRQEIAGSVPWSTVSEMELRAAVEALRLTPVRRPNRTAIGFRTTDRRNAFPRLPLETVMAGATVADSTCSTRNCGASCSC